MVSEELIGILRCPESKQPVELASPEVFAKFLAEGRPRDGSRVEGRVEAGLVREDGRVLYPVRDGIPIMLIKESISLP